MGFKIKNSLTGEFEKLPILTLKGEKGETGGVEEYNKVDYMGNKYETLKQANDANVDYAVKTAIGEFNYLDYEGQHITATNSIEGHARSAILKGKTLVNTVKGNVRVSNRGTNVISVIPTDKSKKYLLKFRINKVATVLKESNTQMAVKLQFFSGSNPKGYHSISNENFNVGFEETIVVEPLASGDEANFIIWMPRYESGELDIDILFIEYQDGMENWDIPYFEGMTSVRMPVLTTVGKNLFNSTFIRGNRLNETGAINQQMSYMTTADYINIKNVDSAMASIGDGYRISQFFLYDDNGNFISRNGNPLTNTANATKCHITIAKNPATEVTDEDLSEVLKTFQLEQGSVATSFEPYKSNILSTLEPVELRGIGDVQDTLNLTTGEIVSNFEPFVFNGSENWILQNDTLENTTRFILKNYVPNMVANQNVGICNNFAWSNYDKDFPGIIITKPSGHVYLRTPKMSVDELKTMLSNNPIHGYYNKEKSIKTVDLSDNIVYSYEGTTHYSCSSEEGSLVPTLSVKVPTDMQATIAQQRKTIQTLNSENERLIQIQEALKASMLDSQVQLMNLSWNTDFEVFTLRESIAPKDFLLASRTGSNIDKFSQAKFIIENDCPDLEKLNSQIEYYFSKDVFSQEQFEELTDLISIVKGGKWL